MKLRFLLVAAGIFGSIVGAYLIWPEVFGLCTPHDRGDGVMVCSAPFWSPYGITTLPLSIAFLVSSLIMLAASRKTFSRWIQFSIGFAVFAAAALIILPAQTIGMAGISLSIFEYKTVAETLAFLYVALSGLLFLFSQFLPRFRK